MMAFARIAFFVISTILLSAVLGACSLPRIIILHDPLSADEHVKLGSIYESQGKADLALKQYRAAIKQDKRNLSAWLRLGDLSSRREQYRDAEKAYEKALDLQPESGDINNNLAWTLLQQDRKLGRAEELVRTALDLTPAHRPYYLDTLGMVLFRLGRAEDAIAALQESAETISPDRPALRAEAYGHLAEVYRASGLADKAAEAAAERDVILQK
jgi:Tfp pilus assembly protein PilF